MPDDLMTETPEDKAAITAMREETDIELVQHDPKPAADPKSAADLKPDPKPTADPAPQPEPKKPVRLVPHEALHEERIKRQALERRLAEIEKPKPVVTAGPEEEDIDETVNPLGAIAQLRARDKARKEQEAEAQRQMAEGREIVQRMAPRVEAYAKEHPEYAEQFQYLRVSRATELELLGWTPDAIVQQVQAEEMALARQTLANDWDPGEVVAKLATHRGWKAKEEPKPDPAKPQQEKKPAAVEKIERLAKGQKAATSSSAGGGGGNAATDEPSIEDLLELDGAAFDKAAKKWITDGKRAGA